MTFENQNAAKQQGKVPPSTSDDRPDTELLTESERSERIKAVSFATASLIQSGFEVTEAMLLPGERYINGEIELNEIVASAMK
ncbi:antitoxin VbhA family protein [Pseudomonas sp. PS01298]|uniref:antitoxin VbhA family protein n=1 Tax=Pseudomonas sp. PS01298 TaxID=2991434 RepID=UPI00249AD077|nr:antitoxin VbhA family protein [Pseudomonas sp. PS01298]